LTNQYGIESGGTPMPGLDYLNFTFSYSECSV
jgi:hypothetical protein